MAGSLELIKSVTGSDVNTLSITNCFSDKYDVYKVVGHTAEYRPTDTNTIDLRTRFIDSGGSIIDGSEYSTAKLEMKAESGFDQDKQASATYMYGATNFGNYDNAGMVIYFYNPNNSSSFTFMAAQGTGGYDTSNSRFRSVKNISVHRSAEQITGVHFLSSSGSSNFDIEISVYGVK
tara:strand:+ start:234 stop:764 length:531 start_codon:yes stop_codon:yes gene_type:complete